MKEWLVKAFGYVMFYTLALGTCMFLGALSYTGISKIAPFPEGLPAALPTRGPPPSPTPTIKNALPENPRRALINELHDLFEKRNQNIDENQK